MSCRIIAALALVLCVAVPPAAAQTPTIESAASTLKAAPKRTPAMPVARFVTRIDQGMTAGGDFRAIIHANFPLLVEQNIAALSARGATAVIAGLSQRELADLAVVYDNATLNSGRKPLLLDLLATRLDGAALGRVSQHFGFGPVYDAVNRLAPTKSQDFLMSASQPAAVSLVSKTGTGMASTTSGFPQFWDYSPYEVYLSYRTAPIGALSVRAALLQTSITLALPISMGWGIGYGAVGPVVNNLMATYAPDLYYSIGGAVAGAVDMLSSFMPGTAASGMQQSVAANAFQLPISLFTNLATSGGDFGATQDWATYGGQSHGAGGGAGCFKGNYCIIILPEALPGQGGGT